jgi:phage repressor protein C with HTH and peptisase S24 domain
MSLGENLKASRVAKGLSQAALARAAGVTQQTIAGIESGRVQRSGRLPEIAAALGTTAEELIHGATISVPTSTAVAAEFAPSLPKPPRAAPSEINLGSLPRDVPVLGQAVGGDNGDFYFNGQIIDYLRRPPGIAAARDVFGLYVTGTSMYPKYEEGEPIYVSAARPPAVGDYVVIELHEQQEGTGNAGYVKRLVRRTPTKIVCEQFNPPMEVEYDRRAVKSVFRVIPYPELVGI